MCEQVCGDQCGAERTSRAVDTQFGCRARSPSLRTHSSRRYEGEAADTMQIVRSAPSSGKEQCGSSGDHAVVCDETFDLISLLPPGDVRGDTG